MLIIYSLGHWGSVTAVRIKSEGRRIQIATLEFCAGLTVVRVYHHVSNTFARGRFHILMVSDPHRTINRIHLWIAVRITLVFGCCGIREEIRNVGDNTCMTTWNK